MRQLLLASILCCGMLTAQVPVPGKWEGKASGTIHGRRFELPVTLELRPALPFESNPFHLFVGTSEASRVGDFGLHSATEMGTGGSVKSYRTGQFGVGVYDRTVARTAGRGNVTLQYLTIRQSGAVVSAELTETQAAAAAAANIFVGPNVSAEQASDLMRGVAEALGPTEMFAFARGATLRLQFAGAELSGTLTGRGASVLGTSGPVEFECQLRARRVP